MKNTPKKTYAHSTKTLDLNQKNQSKICILEVRHAFELKMSNQQINQNTKTTHRKNLTKKYN